MAEAKRDANMVTTLIGVSSADGITPVTIYVDPTTHRVLVSTTAGALDDLTDVTITSVAQGDIIYYSGSAWVNLAPGTSGKFLKTQGAGANPIWDTPTAAPAGLDTQVQFNDGGALAGDTGFVFNKTTNVATLGGLIISGLTASEIVGTDASKNLVSLAVATYPSLTELTYVKGVTSAIQTQLNTKAPSTSPTFATSITGSYLTASEILGTDGSKNIVSLAVATYPSLVELAYVKGATSAIQTQLDARVTKALFDAHTIIYATTDNTPVALTVGEQTVVGRATGGNIAALAIDSDLSSVSTNDDTLPSAKATKAYADLMLPLAGGTMSGNITFAENAALIYDAALSADGKYNGFVRAGTAGATLAFGDLIYLAAVDSRWELANADAASTSGDVLLGMCVLAAAADGNPTTVLMIGFIRADVAFPALTIGAPAYVGTTAGDIQTAQPSGVDDVIRRVGFAWTADELYFNPSNDYVTHT
jgi:hypothetical protein